MSPTTASDSRLLEADSELLPDGLVAAGADACVTYLNRPAERILRVDRADLVGRDIREALPLHDRDGISWWKRTDPWAGLDIRTGHREKLLLLEGGTEILVTAKYIRTGRNRPVAKVLLSIRDAEARRRAEVDNAALISTVAHELRSPLTSVKGFSSTLLRRWDRFTDEQKRLMIETIEADADRVTRLITELLDVSRIDAGRLRIHLQPVDVLATFRRHVERSVASGQSSKDFALEVPDRLPEVWADPDRLDQILSNLIENARIHGRGLITLGIRPIRLPGPDRRAGRDGTGAPDRTAGQDRTAGADRWSASASAAAPEWVQVSVGDQGDGIPLEHRVRAFSRFWHGTSRGSSGLGLYIVKGLVEAHGGTVEVHAAQGGGAEVRFSLPCTPPEHLA